MTFEDDSASDGGHDCKNVLGEKKKFDELIVIGDVSGLADKSNDFSNFLTVS